MAQVSKVAKDISSKIQLQEIIKQFHELVDKSDAAMSLAILANVLLTNHEAELDEESVTMLKQYYEATRWVYRLNVKEKGAK